MNGTGWHDPVYAEDRTSTQSMPTLRWYKFVSPGLLATMGNGLVAGRDFTWTDVYERRPVAMVSKTSRASCGMIRRQPSASVCANH